MIPPWRYRRIGRSALRIPAVPALHRRLRGHSADRRFSSPSPSHPRPPPGWLPVWPFCLGHDSPGLPFTAARPWTRPENSSPCADCCRCPGLRGRRSATSRSGPTPGPGHGAACAAAERFADAIQHWRQHRNPVTGGRTEAPIGSAWYEVPGGQANTAFRARDRRTGSLLSEPSPPGCADVTPSLLSAATAMIDRSGVHNGHSQACP
jgi:hypothetical protein